MAKLSAGGRTELARVEKVEPLADGGSRTFRYALMSDGKLLSSFSIKHPGSPVHNFGWKGRRQVQARDTPGKLIESFVARGYTYIAQ